MSRTGVNVRIIFLVLLAVAGCLHAADSPFVGTWRINMEKSQFAGVRMTIKDLGAGKFERTVGAESETLVADGADHESKYGGTIAFKQDGPDKWLETGKHNGTVTSVVTWTIKDKGKTLTTDGEETRLDGVKTTFVDSGIRIGSGSGLAGTWELKDAHANSIPDWVIKPDGPDGLMFSTPAYHEELDLKFDGKDYEDHGPRVAPGSTASGKRIDDHTIEMTNKVKGKVMSVDRMSVSGDGKVLIIHSKEPGNQVQVIVYDRM